MDTRRRRSLVSVPAILVLLCAIIVGAYGGAWQPAAASDALDPNLRVHPYLQYLAAQDPNRTVQAIVAKQDGAGTLAAQALPTTAPSTAPTTSQPAQSTATRRASATATPDVQTLEEFPEINSTLVQLPARAVLNLAHSPEVRYIAYDAPMMRTAIDPGKLRTTFNETIGVPSVWNAPLPATGRGVGVAILDSGTDGLHPDLAGRVSCVAVGRGERGSLCRDGNGHGTHVAGVVKGRDPLGRYIGVAPDASLISVRVTDEQGYGRLSDVVRGLQWVYNNRTSRNIRVVNLSFAAAVPEHYAYSTVNAFVERLWFAGVVVVASSGNFGDRADAAWFAPGNDPFIITVGALDDNRTAGREDDSLAPFSARGVTQSGVAKPEVVAPGRRIVSTLPVGPSRMRTLYPERITDRNYLQLSGTSMAAPVVTGLVALLLERHPDLTPNQVKWLLQTSAVAYPGQADGAGMVDAPRAFALAASGKIGAANAGLTPAHGSDPAGGGWGTGYWDQGYWDQGYWDQGFWDQNTNDQVGGLD